MELCRVMRNLNVWPVNTGSLLILIVIDEDPDLAQGDWMPFLKNSQEVSTLFFLIDIFGFNLRLFEIIITCPNSTTTLNYTFKNKLTEFMLKEFLMHLLETSWAMQSTSHTKFLSIPGYTGHRPLHHHHLGGRWGWNCQNIRNECSMLMDVQNF